MKIIFWIIISIGFSEAVSAGNSDIASGCDASSITTGGTYNIIGSRQQIRKGPSKKFGRIINRKASTASHTFYLSIDDTATVFEKCTKNNWSWIRVIEPDWLQDSHRGWVPSKFLDKEQGVDGDKHARKISANALRPYTAQGYPKTVAKYGARLKEIEILRKKAALIATDSGKCDYVLMSELSLSRSKPNHLHFWVDCRNKQRIYLDEHQIKTSSPILTQEEKSWDKKSALVACKNAIKVRTLLPSEVDIHTIFGTSFYKAPVTHNVVLRMDFDAINALGIELPYTATCNFEPGKVGEINIQTRN